jgi:DNA-binding MarR family transcriptional regulator
LTRTLAHTETELAERLRSAVGRLSRRLRRTRAARGLPPTSVSVLFTVVKFGPVRASRLAEMEDLNPTMLSRVIGQLADAGLVRRLADPQDGRAALIEASAAGRRLRERILRERAELLGAELGALSSEDQETLARALPVLEGLVERLKDRRE